MSIPGIRVQALLDSHGHSYDEAARITGVSRETIRRVCLGYMPAKLRKYLRQIANGYGVDELALLEESSPKADFEWHIKQASPSQRLEFLLMTPAERVILTLDFIRAKYPNSVPIQALASACGKTQPETKRMLDKWNVAPPDRQMTLAVATALHNFTSIPMAWFARGYLANWWAEPASCLPLLSAHVRMNESASTAEGMAALSKLLQTV